MRVGVRGGASRRRLPAHPMAMGRAQRASTRVIRDMTADGTGTSQVRAALPAAAGAGTPGAPLLYRKICTKTTFGIHSVRGCM